MVDGSKTLKDMKKLLYMMFLAVSAVAAFTACTHEKDEVSSILVGEWNYTEGETEVYIAFSADNKFDLYQKWGAEYIRYYYTGTYEFDGKVLKGMYTGYIPFAHDYNVSRSGNKLTLTSVSEPDYSVTYVKKSIPEEVRTHFMPVTKASEEAPVPFL